MMFAWLLIPMQKLLFFAATAGASCSLQDVDKNVPGSNFLLLPHWWEYMNKFQYDTLGQCQPVFNFPSGIFPVGLALLDILLRLAGFVAIIAIIAAGVQYIFAQGNSEKAAAARKGIYNALIGLGIVFTATLLVTFVGKSLAK